MIMKKPQHLLEARNYVQDCQRAGKTKYDGGHWVPRGQGSRTQGKGGVQ